MFERYNGVPAPARVLPMQNSRKTVFFRAFHNAARPQIPFSCENIHNHTVVDILVRAATPLCLSNTVFTVRAAQRLYIYVYGKSCA